jgi:23S rRNA pseudouridine1911/1915/1917 synthase
MEPRVIFQDDQVIVLNKPAGWVVNRVDSAGGPVLQDWIENQFPDITASPGSAGTFRTRSGIVHRLDKETSGVLLVAKTPAAFANLTQQFAVRSVKKQYLTLVHGRMDQQGTIEAPVGRLPWNRERFGVFGEGKNARTGYKVRLFYNDPVIKDSSRDKYKGVLSFVEVYPESGRTHQIRVHFKSIGNPIVADEFYAGRKIAREDRTWCPRLFLHAFRIEFTHPTAGSRPIFTSPLPDDLSLVIGRLKPR